MPKLQTLHMDKKMFVGVDGCRAGWFAVALTETDSFGVFSFLKSRISIAFFVMVILMCAYLWTSLLV
jgi:predicted RNase H-like nuclease